MKSSKFQAPTSREIPMTEDQTRSPWSLKFGASLVLESWCLMLLLIGSNSRGQSYSVDWHTIDGGGGTSAGGVYSVSGTIGQPDAEAAMTGGQYSLTGGFWSLYAVQTQGAPSLRIFLTTSNTAVVTWPSPSTGWLLQQNTNGVNSTNWSNVTATIQDNGATKALIEHPFPQDNRFYRLFKP